MASILIEIAVRLINTVLGALLGFGLLAGGRSPRLRFLGLDLETRLLIGTVVGALIGLVWGKRIWRYIDTKIDGGWTGKGP